MRHHISPIRSARTVLVAVLLALTAGVFAVGIVGTSQAATIGTLTMAPPAGLNTTPIDVMTSAGCPDGGTNVVARVYGSGFPAGGYQVVGNTDAGISQSSPFQVALGDTFQVFMSAQPVPVPLTGRYDIKVICRDALEPASLGEFVGSITFTDPTHYTSTDPNPTQSVTATPPTVTTTVSPTETINQTTSGSPSTTPTDSTSTSESATPTDSTTATESSTATVSDTTSVLGTEVGGSGLGGSGLGGSGGGQLAATGARVLGALGLALALLVGGSWLIAATITKPVRRH